VGQNFSKQQNECVQNKTTLKCAKNHGNLFRHFEDISRRFEPWNVVAYFFGPPCTRDACVISLSPVAANAVIP